MLRKQENIRIQKVDRFTINTYALHLK